jgi:hypothetical protein
MTGRALRLLAVAALLLVPGIVLVIVGSNGLLGLGIALMLLASVPGTMGVGLLFSASLARWAARHKLFA